jgi:hypothetical protein
MFYQLHARMISILSTALIASTALGQAVDTPIAKIGDTREYQTTDDWTSQVRSEQRVEVIGVLPGYARIRSEWKTRNLKTNAMEPSTPEEDTIRSDFNVDVFSKAGNSRRVNFSWPLDMGKKWSYEYSTDTTGANGQSFTSLYKMTAEVVGWESVTTPAGSFKTLKVIHKGTVQTPSTPAWGVSNVGWTYWYDPQISLSVKSNYQWDSATGAPGTRTTTVVTSVKRPAGY